MMLEVPSPLPLGMAASVVISRPPPKPASTSRSGRVRSDPPPTTNGYMVPDMVPGRESGDHQGRFHQRECPYRGAEIEQFVPTLDVQMGAQIDRAHADHRLGCHSPVDLNRRLSVQQHRGVAEPSRRSPGCTAGCRSNRRPGPVGPGPAPRRSRRFARRCRRTGSSPPPPVTIFRRR